jgi:mono/diheme cytochrome c family protein
MSDKPTDRIDVRDTTDVPQLMSRVYKEHEEPRDGFEPVPVWMAAAFGILIFWAGWYVASNSGNYTPDYLDQPNPNSVGPSFVEPKTPEEMRALGSRLYSHCVVCHQADGKGVEGLYPPLQNADWLVGEKATPGRLARLMLHGGKGEWEIAGNKFTHPMPAYGNWKDYEIAAVLTFVRGSWGNAADPIAAEEIAKAREATKGRPVNGSAGWTMADLLKSP